MKHSVDRWQVDGFSFDVLTQRTRIEGMNTIFESLVVSQSLHEMIKQHGHDDQNVIQSVEIGAATCIEAQQVVESRDDFLQRFAEEQIYSVAAMDVWILGDDKDPVDCSVLVNAYRINQTDIHMFMMICFSFQVDAYIEKAIKKSHPS